MEVEDYMTVGFIGLGHMGQAMARNLLRAGFAVAVYNRSRAKADALAADGAKVVTTVADACRGDVVITMLATTGRSRRPCFAAMG
jgi:3-hydroxyisobutyrate dehydrogenase-like beta-hydroxyacid dehydrogenase